MAGVLLLGLALPLSGARAANSGFHTAAAAANAVVMPIYGQTVPDIGGNLTYHGGPVMHTNTTFAIYWFPAGSTVSSHYVSLINGFFANVAAASGVTTDVYANDTQYFDNQNGHILNSSTVGGSVVDTDAFPASGCHDSLTVVCLTDQQIQREINKVIMREGWQRGPSSIFFLFTPKDVGSCLTATQCAFTLFCAYHSHFGSGSSVTLYGNQPYAAFVPSACVAPGQQSPNGDDADFTLNGVSHEHNEAITDEQASAWFDVLGQEIGDKCNFKFGKAMGRTQFGGFNQLINGGTYYIQQEHSNLAHGCVLTGV